MNIAVIGGGVSGLVAADALHRRHRVTLFERDARLGGHAHTVRVDLSDETHAVDVGFIVYNEVNYPAFTAILQRLGVQSQPSEMSFSVRGDDDSIEYSSIVPQGLYAARGNALRPRFHRMVFDYLRFKRIARHHLRSSKDEPRGLIADFIAAHNFSRQFIDWLLVPLGASIWSADRDCFLAFPARYVLAFFDNHGLLNTIRRPRWRTIVGGSERYVEAMARSLGPRIRAATPVEAVWRDDRGVTVRLNGGHVERFDQVVIAAHSDQALAMLRDASERERAVLGAFPYQRNTAVLHTDRALLPRRRRAWAAWNYHLPRDPAAPVGVTYHLNRLQSLRSSTQMCVTLNRDAAIAENAVVRRLAFEHPLYTPASQHAQTLHHTISGVHRTHFCGAYWGSGFHEDGVQSALRVAAQLDAAAA